MNYAIDAKKNVIGFFFKSLKITDFFITVFLYAFIKCNK